MKALSLTRALAAGCIGIVGLAACGPTPQNLANPTVKGDKSTISGDAKATAEQKTEAH